MSSLEKSLYKQVTVKGKGSTQNVTPGSRAYRGISTVNPDNSTFVLYDIALIKQDIINHFHIRQGEKLSNPEFGTIIWDILFEPLTEPIKDAIVNNVSKIVNYDPRVNVNNVVVDQYESGIQVECNLVYLPYNISETLRMRFDENAGFLNT
jgi:phage baseplate assembly protein W